MASHNDDLLAALQWGLLTAGTLDDLQRARTAIELALALVFYWRETDHGSGVWWTFERGIEPARRLGDPGLLARVLYRAGELDEMARMVDPHWAWSEPITSAGKANPSDHEVEPMPARERLGRALLQGDERLPQLLMDLGLSREAGWLVQDAAVGLFYGAGDLDGAEELFQRSLAIKAASVPLLNWELAINYGWLGEVYRARHQLPEADAVLDKALTLFAIDNGLGTHRGWSLLNHAQTSLALERVASATQDLRLVVEEARGRRHLQFGLNALPVFAALALRQGSACRAARLLGAAIARWAEVGDDFHAARRMGFGPADWEAFAATEAAARQSLSPAAWEQALAQGAALSAEAALAYAMGESDPWAGAEEGRA